MKTVIVVNQDGMGSGEEELGSVLIGAFLKKIWIRPDKPETLILYHGGVKLLCKESNVLDALDGLEQAGVEIVACGTCLDYYNIDVLKVGRRSDMGEIVQLMMDADKVITV